MPTRPASASLLAIPLTLCLTVAAPLPAQMIYGSSQGGSVRIVWSHGTPSNGMYTHRWYFVSTLTTPIRLCFSFTRQTPDGAEVEEAEPTIRPGTNTDGGWWTMSRTPDDPPMTAARECGSGGSSRSSNRTSPSTPSYSTSPPPRPAPNPGLETINRITEDARRNLAPAVEGLARTLQEISDRKAAERAERASAEERRAARMEQAAEESSDFLSSRGEVDDPVADAARQRILDRVESAAEAHYYERDRRIVLPKGEGFTDQEQFKWLAKVCDGRERDKSQRDQANSCRMVGIYLSQMNRRNEALDNWFKGCALDAGTGGCMNIPEALAQQGDSAGARAFLLYSPYCTEHSAERCGNAYRRLVTPVEVDGGYAAAPPSPSPPPPPPSLPWNVIHDASGYRPVPGFEWVNPAASADYRVRPKWNLIESPPGSYTPLPGFQWVSAKPAVDLDYRVRPMWNLVQQDSNLFAPLPGFTWRNQDSAMAFRDLRVVPALGLNENPDGTYSPAPGLVFFSPDPARDRDFRTDIPYAKGAPAKLRNYLWYATAKLARGDTAEALTYFQKAVASAPDSGYGYEQIVGIHGAQRRYAEAVRVARQWVGVAPKSAGAHNDLAWWLLYLNQNTEALVEAAAAVRLGAGAAYIHDTYGCALARAQRFPEAEAQFLRATQLDPNTPDYRARLILAQQHRQPVLP